MTLRTFLMAMLLGAVLLVLVAWAAMHAAMTGNNAGRFGAVALRIATFPVLVQAAWTEALDSLSGREEYKHLSVPRTATDLSEFTALASTVQTRLPGLVMAGDPRAGDRGWRVFGGAFVLDNAVANAVVLVDPDFTVRRIWRLDETGLPQRAGASVARKLVHGLELLPDGSIIAVFDNGSSLQRIDACGHRQWARSGLYHHAVTYDPRGDAVWTLRDDGFDGDRRPDAFAGIPTNGFVRIDAATGETLSAFTVGDLIAANPEFALFEIPGTDTAAAHENALVAIEYRMPDPFHFNDVDPLPHDLAGVFPMFAPGDLLLSARNLNAVLVVDPETLRIKWHRAGTFSRQHDPDWLTDGTIGIFDNRMNAGPSRIVALDPADMRQEVLVDGADHDLFTRIRGKHARSGRGDLMLSSPQQGRAVEIGADGEIVMEYYNLGPAGTGLNLALTEFLWIAEDALNPGETSCEKS